MQQLCEGFKMKDMGKLHYLLGISVQMQDGKVMLDQKQYLINILRKFGLEGAKSVNSIGSKCEAGKGRRLQ